MKLMRSLLPVTKPVILFLVLVVIIGIAVAMVTHYQPYTGANTTTPAVSTHMPDPTTTPRISPAVTPEGFSTNGAPEIITPLASGAVTAADTVQHRLRSRPL